MQTVTIDDIDTQEGNSIDEDIETDGVEQEDYKRPFEQEDFRGYFRWSAKLTSLLGGNLYHACHEDQLETILNSGELGLYSKWKLKLPQHGLWEAPGIWTGLNYFHSGNYYVPFLITFPLSVLNGHHFMVFRREVGRRRYFFIQYEARIPIYSFGEKLWRKVRPSYYFYESSSGLSLKPGAIYDIVLTQVTGLDDVTIEAVEHPWCINEKCQGMSKDEGSKELQVIALAEFYYWLSKDKKYKRLFRRFSVLDKAEVTLCDPEDIYTTTHCQDRKLCFLR